VWLREARGGNHSTAARGGAGEGLEERAQQPMGWMPVSAPGMLERVE
jgi:hypothetical protein